MPHKEIFDRFFLGEISIEEEKELFQWLNQDASHVRIFLSARKSYDLSLMADEQIAVPENINIDAEYEKIREYIEKEKELERNNNRIFRRKKYIKYLKQTGLYAASIIGLAFIIHLSIPKTELFPPASETAEIQIPGKTRSHMTLEPQDCKTIGTDNGDKKKITLPDNTTVWINSKSKLKYPPKFDGKLREVWLEGEAYFEVSHDPSHQFIVHTQEFDIKVYGTSFNVSAYNDYSNKSYTLVEGSIRLSSNIDLSFNELHLTPGQQVTYDSGKIEIKEIDPSLEASWREGKFYFRGKPFADICHQLELAFNVKVFIEGENLKKSIYTGDFVRNESIDEILTIMSTDKRMEYKIRGNVITIKEK